MGVAFVSFTSCSSTRLVEEPGEENATVAHVTSVKEEVAAEVVPGAAEPEVAKKGKTDAAAPAADAKKAPAADAKKK